MYETLKKTIKYENNWIRLWEDAIRFPDGSEGIYGYLDRRDEGGIVLVMDDQKRLLILHEWRYPIHDWTWCWPAGGAYEGEDRQISAARELEEETGILAKTWIDFGTLHIDPGGTSQCEKVYLAKDLHRGTMNKEASEIHEIHWKTIDEIKDMIRSNEIDNGWFLAGFAKLLIYLETAT